MCALEWSALSVTSMGPLNNLPELPAPPQRNLQHCLDSPFRDRAFTTCVRTGLYIYQSVMLTQVSSWQRLLETLSRPLSSSYLITYPWRREVVSEQNRNKNNNDLVSRAVWASLPREDLAYYSPLYQDMGTMPGYFLIFLILHHNQQREATLLRGLPDWLSSCGIDIWTSRERGKKLQDYSQPQYGEMMVGGRWMSTG